VKLILQMAETIHLAKSWHTSGWSSRSSTGRIRSITALIRFLASMLLDWRLGSLFFLSLGLGCS
jgi:hypothetical protein